MRRNISILATLPLIIAFAGCDDNHSGSGGIQEIFFNEPCQEWGTPLTTVKQLMQDFTLLAEDDDMLVYKGDMKESIISYGFESQKLSTANVFISADSIEIIDLMHSFNRYERVGNNLTYVNTSINTVGEIVIVEKSDNRYHCLSWSYLDDL